MTMLSVHRFGLQRFPRLTLSFTPTATGDFYGRSPSHPAVDEQHDDRAVTPCPEVAAGAAVDQAAQVVGGDHRGLGLGRSGGADALARVDLDLALGDQPAVEVPHAGGGCARGWPRSVRRRGTRQPTRRQARRAPFGGCHACRPRSRRPPLPSPRSRRAGRTRRKALVVSRSSPRTYRD